MISHSLVSGQSNIQPPSRGPFQSGLPGIAMKEPRLEMSPRLKLFPPVEHNRTWTYNQEGSFLVANLSLLGKELKKILLGSQRIESSYTVDVRVENYFKINFGQRTTNHKSAVHSKMVKKHIKTYEQQYR